MIKSQSGITQQFILLSLILASLVMTSSTAFAQGDYLDRGQGGLEFSLGYSSYDNTEAYLAGFGYTAKGRVDFRLAAGKIDWPGGDYIAVFPSAVFYPYKRYSDNSLFALTMIVGSRLDVKSNEGVSNSDESNSQFHAGAGLLYGGKLTSRIRIQPELGVHFIAGTIYNNNAIGLSWSISTLVKLSSGYVIRINPGVTLIDKLKTFTISIGMIFPNSE